MQKWWLFLIALAFTAAIFTIPSPAEAQYPRGYNPYRYPQYYYSVPRGPQARVPYNPYYYYFYPNRNVVRKWRRYRMWLEYQNQFRSPLNRESTLEYMLRTF